MTDPEEKSVEPSESEGELSKKHLLALIFEVGMLRQSVAAKKIGVEPGVLSEWAKELEEDGWIKLSDVEFGDPKMEITKEGLHRKKGIVKELEEQQRKDLESLRPRLPFKEKFRLFGARFRALTTRVLSSLVDNVRDVLLILSLLLSTRLLYHFFLNPGAAAFEFLFGSALISLVLLLYRQYENYLKTRKFLSFMEWNLMVVNQRRKHIAILITLILMIYLVGLMLLDPEDSGMYLMASMVVLTTGILLYYPKDTISELLRFYLGMMLLMYSLLVMTGALSITRFFFGTQSPTVDVVVGLLLLLFLQVNQVYFGVGVSKFRELVERSRSA